jgi:phage-related minor tail protein
MDEEIDRLVIGVRADTAGFAQDIVTMKTGMEDGLGRGGARAAASIEAALAKAIRTGKFGFEDLAQLAIKVLGQIAGVATTAGAGGSGIGVPCGCGPSSGPISLLAALGLPGRATGGPVSPGAAYLVGERGPEMFVPTTSGRIAAAGMQGGARDVKVSIAVQAGTGEAPRALARSSRQVARAVARAITQAGD